MGSDKQPIELTKPLLWLMTIGAGLVVANNYYNQPLLGKIAADFKVNEALVSKVAMLTQVGYAVGLLLIIPLGDMVNRRKLIIIDFVFMMGTLIAAGLSQSIYTLMCASFFIGLTSVIPQLFIPLAAQLANPQEKGKAVGIVLGGLLIGILCSRTLSGFVGEHFGWKPIFFIAAVFMFLLWIAIIFMLPNIESHYKGSYRQLMASLGQLIKTQPILRLASTRGMLGFASFSAFWTTLGFLMEGPPFFKGSDITGSFGLVGAAGALAASFFGRLSDKINRNKLISIAIAVMLLSWIIFGVFSYSFIGLIIGVILLDAALQSMHITNQTIIFELNAEARNRLNTVYMVSYFIGGASGTWLAGIAWQHYQWNGVVILGLVLLSATFIFHLLFAKKNKIIINKI